MVRNDNDRWETDFDGSMGMFLSSDFESLCLRRERLGKKDKRDFGLSEKIVRDIFSFLGQTNPDNPFEKVKKVLSDGSEVELCLYRTWDKNLSFAILRYKGREDTWIFKGLSDSEIKLRMGFFSDGEFENALCRLVFQTTNAEDGSRFVVCNVFMRRIEETIQRMNFFRNLHIAPLKWNNNYGQYSFCPRCEGTSYHPDICTKCYQEIEGLEKALAYHRLEKQMLELQDKFLKDVDAGITDFHKLGIVSAEIVLAENKTLDKK